MSHSSEDETDVSESELDEYVDRCYEELKLNAQKVIFSDELYRCPYCPGKKKMVYPFKDLLQHASDLGKGYQNNDVKRKAKHMGLVRFMNSDIFPSNGGSLSSEFSGLALETPAANEPFVWPWMGILANVSSEGVSKVKNDLVRKGLHPARIRPLSKLAGGYAVVEFEKTWSGFYKAVMFEKSFEAENLGKKDYRNAPCDCDDDDDVLYGWIAREDDYNMKGVLGDYLGRNGDLKTVDDVEAEEKRRNGMLVADLTETIEDLRRRLGEVGR